MEGELNYAKVKAHASKTKWKDTLADFWAFLGKTFFKYSMLLVDELA